MRNLFDVTLEKLEKIDNMPGAWEDQDYHALLSAIEVDGMEAMQGEELLDEVDEYSLKTVHLLKALNQPEKE